MDQSPNILFITDDQHRYDYLSLTGKFPVRTPNLERLAREGVWHRHAYSPCPLCMPARCSLHNGLYAHQHGMNVNRAHWPLGLPTLPRALRQAGYHTAAIGKLHVYEGVPERLDLTRPEIEASIRGLGYDHLHEVSGKGMAYYLSCRWTDHMRAKDQLDAYRAEQPWRERRLEGVGPFQFDEADYQDAYIGDHCVEWLEQVPAGRPFFLWAGLVSPHPPSDPPASLVAHYPPGEQPLPVDCDDPAAWRQTRANYAAMVEMVDLQVGRMLDVLDRRGLLENTLVIFTADHGELLGDHGLDGKCKPHDPSSRVPLLARWPGVIRPGSVSDGMVELTDLPATCLHAATGEDAAGRWLPATPGRSLLPVWSGEAEAVRDFVYSEDGGQFTAAYQMIRTHQWKYVLEVDNGRELLFDMLDDPDECRNLADSPAHASTREDLKRRLLAHLAQTPPPIRD